MNKVSLILVVLSLKGALSFAATPAGTSTTCCWCKNQFSKDNEVKRFFSDETCERSPAVGTMYSSCQKVSIEGSSCSFVEVVKAGNGIKCTRNNLVYLDGNERKLISPPEGPLGPCEQPRFAQSGIDLGGTETRGGAHIVEASASCTCGTDPEDPSRCVLLHPGGAVMQSAPRPGGGSGCSEKICRDLFGDSIATQCGSYRQ